MPNSLCALRIWQIVDRLLSRTPLDGGRIEGEGFIHAISIADARARKHGIEILWVENCTIANLKIEDYKLQTPIHFVRCDFTGVISAKNIELESLSVEECRAHRQVVLEDLRLNQSTLEFDAVNFHAGFSRTAPLIVHLLL